MTQLHDPAQFRTVGNTYALSTNDGTNPVQSANQTTDQRVLVHFQNGTSVKFDRFTPADWTNLTSNRAYSFHVEYSLDPLLVQHNENPIVRPNVSLVDNLLKSLKFVNTDLEFLPTNSVISKRTLIPVNNINLTVEMTHRHDNAIEMQCHFKGRVECKFIAPVDIALEYAATLIMTVKDELKHLSHYHTIKDSNCHKEIPTSTFFNEIDKKPHHSIVVNTVVDERMYKTLSHELIREYEEALAAFNTKI